MKLISDQLIHFKNWFFSFLIKSRVSETTFFKAATHSLTVGQIDLTLFVDLTLIAAWFHYGDFDNWSRWGTTKLMTIYNLTKHEINGIFNHRKLNSYFLEHVLFNKIDFFIEQKSIMFHLTLIFDVIDCYKHF